MIAIVFLHIINTVIIINRSTKGVQKNYTERIHNEIFSYLSQGNNAQHSTVV